jgi:AraC-like DNA-binding protein
MRFQLLDVPMALRPHVLAFWSADSAADDGRSRTFQAMADGSPGLLVRLHGTTPLTTPDRGVLPAAMVYGQSTAARQLVTEGRFHAFGAIFRPDALHTVFGVRADELTNGCADLHDLVPQDASASLADREGPATPDALARSIAASLLRTIAARGRTMDPMIAAALDRVHACAGALAPADLRQALGISERGLQRRFEQHLGISPRMYLRLVRFQASMRAWDDGAPGRLSDLAYDAAYADQSHHIRTFREFAGVTPGEYATRVKPVATGLVEVA